MYAKAYVATSSGWQLGYQKMSKTVARLVGSRDPAAVGFVVATHHNPHRLLLSMIRPAIDPSVTSNMCFSELAGFAIIVEDRTDPAMSIARLCWPIPIILTTQTCTAGAAMGFVGTARHLRAAGVGNAGSGPFKRSYVTREDHAQSSNGRTRWT